MTSPDPLRCSEQVRNAGYVGATGGFHQCLNAPKQDGLCGIHLAARDKRAVKKAADAERRAESDRRAKAAQEACEILAKVGIKAHPDYSFGQHVYTGGVVVQNPARLLELL